MRKIQNMKTILINFYNINSHFQGFWPIILLTVRLTGGITEEHL